MPTDDIVQSIWDSFNPVDYLNEYYRDVGPENYALLKFTNDAVKSLDINSTVLDFGCGPTIYPLLSVAKIAKEIHICDFLDQNLNEVVKWIKQEASAFNWSEFTKVVLSIEDSSSKIDERENDVRNKLTNIFHCDIRKKPPIPIDANYDVIIAYFCADSSTNSLTEWAKRMENLSSIVKPGGYLLMSALKNSKSYKVGAEDFPAVRLNEKIIRCQLSSLGFRTINLTFEPADRPSRDYEGIIMTCNKKTQ